MTTFEQKCDEIREIIQTIAKEHGLRVSYIHVRSSEPVGKGVFIDSIEITADRCYTDPDTVVTTV